jgi:putative ABC transport system permease protein
VRIQLFAAAYRLLKEAAMTDLRFALRQLRRHPGYAAVVVATLGVALGAVTALVSVADATLFATLPHGGDRVVSIYDRQPQLDGPASTSWPELVDWRREASQLEGVAGERFVGLSWRGGGEPERVNAMLVSEDYFRVFGASARHGRTFSAEEHRKGGPNVAVLAHGFFTRAYGGDARIVGRSVQLGGQAYTVVGVLPPGTSDQLQGPRDVYIPIEPRLPSDARGEHYLRTFARLRPGVTVESARAELEVLGPKLDTTGSGHRIGVRSLREALYGKAGAHMNWLFLGAALLLFLAAANVTSIMLARLQARSHELGVRAALGANRGQLVRQLLVESVLLALLGGALGLLLALWGKDLLLGLWPQEAAKPPAVPVAWPTLLIAGLLATAVGTLIGILPALRGSRTDLAGALRTSAVARTGLLRQVLVVAQHAIAIVLLACAALFGKSLFKLVTVQPGFDPEGVVTMTVSLPEARYPDHAARRGFIEDVIGRLRSLPGVAGASAVNDIPFGRSTTSGSFTIEGRPDFPAGNEPHTGRMLVDGEYFRTMRIPLLAGRSFTPSDRRLLTIINQTFAERYFPGESPLGRRIDTSGGMSEIVGVVGDVRRTRLDAPPELQVYLNFEQTTPWVSFVVRAAGDPTALFGAMKAQVYAVDKEQPVATIGTLDGLVASSAAQRRVFVLMLAGFAAAALLLAALGVYGLLSYSVSQRTREIGVRMALGARAGMVLRLVMAQGMLLSVIGVAIGVAVAYLVAHLMPRLLYGVSPGDPLVYAAVVALLVGVGLLASFLPARRAAQVDPMSALRSE